MSSTEPPFEWTPEDVTRMAEEEGLPVLPYADRETGHSSGWSGSDTSKERAHEADADGTTALQERLTKEALRRAQTRGLTYKELGDVYGWGHGVASGVLSRLHKVGQIEGLTLRRNKCRVYVMPEFVFDRKTSPYKPNAGERKIQRVLAWLDEREAEGSTVVDVSAVRQVINQSEKE